MTTLPARAAYRLWAPHYDGETAVSALESQVVQALKVATAGRSLIDVGCGTGRRLRDIDAAFAIGVDVTPEMLRHARGQQTLAADVAALPVRSARFDVVWCRLVIGHVR